MKSTLVINENWLERGHLNIHLILNIILRYNDFFTYPLNEKRYNVIFKIKYVLLFFVVNLGICLFESLRVLLDSRKDLMDLRS